MRQPKTLREALDRIQEMLTKQPYSADLWDVLVGLRGPDSRNRKLKYATTAVIRQAAFPSRPCEDRSIFGPDTRELATRRKQMFQHREDYNHFREHCRAAFKSLGLSLYEINSPSN